LARATPISRGRRCDRGHQADIDARGGEHRPVAGQADVAGQGQLQPAAEAPAVDGGDHRHAQGLDPVHQPVEVLDRLQGGGGGSAMSLAQVVAGAEHPAPAGQHHRPGLVVGGDLVEDLHQLGPHGQPQGVGRRGVQLQQQDRAGGAADVDHRAHRATVADERGFGKRLRSPSPLFPAKAGIQIP
jgi:hypothetical protein